MSNKSFAAEISIKSHRVQDWLCSMHRLKQFIMDLMVDWVNRISVLTLALTISLIGNRQVHKRQDPNFGHNGSSADVFSWKHSSMPWPPKKPILHCIKDYGEHSTSSILQKLIRAAEKSQYVPCLCMLLAWQDGLMHHWRPIRNVYQPDWVTYSKLGSVISSVLHLFSPLIDTSLTFIALLRASFLERESPLPKFCTETSVTVLKPALTAIRHKSWSTDGYCESLHFASPAISAHVPVSPLDIRAWARGCPKKKLKGVISTPEGLLKAFRRPSTQLEGRMVH